MPQIGAPPSNSPNKFSNIKMRASDSLGDSLNKLSGNNMVNNGVKYVDGKKHNKMGKDEFLKLLTVQLGNQDPMNPVDQKKFAAELAQFSQLEQLAAMNAKLNNLNNNTPQEAKFFGASFLGKEVTTNGSTVNLKSEGSSQSLGFRLNKPASKALLKVIDQKGQTITTIETKALRQGPNKIHWDGKRLDGQKANKGTYTFQVHAWDENNEPFNGETKTSGLVDGVRFSD